MVGRLEASWQGLLIFELVQNFHNTTTVERVRRSARFEAERLWRGGEIAGAGETDGEGETTVWREEEREREA